MHKLASLAPLASAVLVSGAALGVAVLAPAHADAPTDRQNVAGSANATLAQLRASLRPLQDSPATAQAAGYRPTDVCVASPAGGMGYHYVNTDLLNGTVDVETPEALLYEPGPNGQLNLVAVEYVNPKAAWSSPTPPTLFGRDFVLNKFDLWALHVWVWENNPDGIFADWNPNVSCENATTPTMANFSKPRSSTEGTGRRRARRARGSPRQARGESRSARGDRPGAISAWSWRRRRPCWPRGCGR